MIASCPSKDDNITHAVRQLHTSTMRPEPGKGDAEEVGVRGAAPL